MGQEREARKRAEDFVREALLARECDNYDVVTVSHELTISDGVGCVVCGAVLLA